MKKIIHILIALAFLLALVPAAASAHTEDDPLVVDLLAGQTTDIGDVEVWNDADTLYVKFVYSGPDCGFLEVHLQVDEDEWDEGILTKKGNPIPGQFEKSYSNGCFEDYTFTYNLADEGFDPGDSLMIAAHAALGLEEAMTIISDTSTQITEVNGIPITTWAVLANEPVDYPNCTSYAPDGIGSAWDSQVNIPDAHWIWNTPDPEHPIEGDVVTFKKTFSIPGLPNGGTLDITADNGYKAMLNDITLGQAQLGPGFPDTLKETTDTTPQNGNWGVASQGWQSVESYPILDLMSGENSITIIAANEYMWNDGGHSGPDYYYGSWNPPGPPINADPFPGYGSGVDNICRNPAGLIFKATVNYYVDGETAWGCGIDDQGYRDNCDDFPGKNWATYFTYTVQCAVDPGLVNGDFEYPVVTTPQGWDIYDSGTPDLGWTVEWADAYSGAPSPAHLELHRGVNGWLPYEGSQHAELDTDWQGPGSAGGEQASVRIYQDLQTCGGWNYQVSFAYSPRPGHADNVLKVYWDGDLLDTYTADGTGNSNTDWTYITLNVSASGSLTRLEFVEAGFADSLGMFLDDVSVTKCDGTCP